MSPIIHSKKQFDVLCSEKSIYLLNEAIRRNKLPSRQAHIWLSLTITPQEIFSFAKHLLGVISNIFLTILLPISQEEKQPKQVLIYRMYCLLTLDPLSVISHIATSIIRITATALGIGLPSLAAKGWLCSEHLEREHLILRANLWKKIIPYSPYLLERHEIIPDHALRYLSHPCCIELEESTKKAQELIQLDRKIRQDFADYLTYLQRREPTRFEDAFKIGTNTRTSTIPILQKLQRTSVESSDQMIQKARDLLTIEEISLLRSYIGISILTANAVGFKNRLVNMIRTLNGETNINFNEYFEKLGKLNEKLSFRLRFGSVLYPTPSVPPIY